MLYVAYPDLRPKWIKDEDGFWQPDVDETTGTQNREAFSTYHQIPWPNTDHSALTAEFWVNASKGWDDNFNPVSG